jgi:peptidoglycan-associated lipoprotein
VIYAPPPPVVIVPNQAYAYPDPPPKPRGAPPPQPAPAAVLQPIYFDLNKSDIKPDASKTLTKNLAWFKQNPGKKVSIQGNCDPRATEQYNTALGKRRAEATKKYLVRLGLDEARLETISYGKGRSTCKGKDESCWAKERRVDFVPIH